MIGTHNPSQSPKGDVRTMTNGDAPWRDEELLYQKYVVEEKSTYEVADELGCAATTVGEWLERHEIESRSQGSGLSRDAPWKDKETLEELYKDKGMNTYEIGQKFGCTSGTIRQWLIKFDIPRRYSHPQFKTRRDGYETVRHQIDGKVAVMRVHRLLAYAHGKISFSELFDRSVNVHHKSNIPWDNRPDNLEKMTHGDHSSLHNSGEYQSTL